jgi:hypothetical protein
MIYIIDIDKFYNKSKNSDVHELLEMSKYFLSKGDMYHDNFSVFLQYAVGYYTSKPNINGNTVNLTYGRIYNVIHYDYINDIITIKNDYGVISNYCCAKTYFYKTNGDFHDILNIETIRNVNLKKLDI